MAGIEVKLCIVIGLYKELSKILLHINFNNIILYIRINKFIYIPINVYYKTTYIIQFIFSFFPFPHSHHYFFFFFLHKVSFCPGKGIKKIKHPSKVTVSHNIVWSFIYFLFLRGFTASRHIYRYIHKQLGCDPTKYQGTPLSDNKKQKDNWRKKQSSVNKKNRYIFHPPSLLFLSFFFLSFSRSLAFTFSFTSTFFFISPRVRPVKNDKIMLRGIVAKVFRTKRDESSSPKTFLFLFIYT